MSAPQNLLIFGGAFDPPHNGHVNLLQNAVKAVNPGLVMVVPSGTSPHKKNSETPWHLRAQMCQCFAPLAKNLVISDIEQARGGKSYTYDTVCSIKQQQPQANIFLAIGSDMLEDFTTWHRWKELLRPVTLVATPRCASEVCDIQYSASLLQSAGGRVIFATGQVVEVSSVGIRSAVASGKADALLQVPALVASIIKENWLYAN